MKIWQIGCGSRGRDYSSLFLQHDLMFLGPGGAGPFDEHVYAAEVRAERVSEHKAHAIQRFCEDVEPGHHVLLRKGHHVLGVGVVPEEGYAFNAAFDDVHGWDLQHTRRVVWQEQLCASLAERQKEAGIFSSRKMIPMFTQVKDEEVLSQIKDLLGQCQPRPLRPLPTQPSSHLDEHQLGQELFARGLSHATTDHVLAAFRRQRRLLGWYDVEGKKCNRPSEHEVVAHMILPLLLALGWSEQLLAVEWHNVDLAGFSKTPTDAASCVLVCEAKGLRHGLQSAWEQAREYVEGLQLNSCRRILLTQGGRFYLYSAVGETERPVAYLNIDKIRVLNADGTNAIDAIMQLRP